MENKENEKLARKVKNATNLFPSVVVSKDAKKRKLPNDSNCFSGGNGGGGDGSKCFSGGNDGGGDGGCHLADDIEREKSNFWLSQYARKLFYVFEGDVRDGVHDSMVNLARASLDPTALSTLLPHGIKIASVSFDEISFFQKKCCILSFAYSSALEHLGNERIEGKGCDEKWSWRQCCDDAVK